MIKCIIIDDEQHCIDALAAILKNRFAKQVEVIASETDPRKALALLAKKQPDLVFLDVEMPHMNGIDVLQVFPERKFEVIFTTAHDKYALQALRGEALDYLLKPISIEELNEAIGKFHKPIAAQKEEKNTSLHKLSLPTANGLLFADVDDIIRIESDNNYCTLFFINKPKLVVAKTLKEFEEMPGLSKFFRVHQSHMVNLRYVESYHSGVVDYVLLSNGEQVEISRRRKAGFMERFSSL
jgi:two-component system LytT family response regulator